VGVETLALWAHLLATVGLVGYYVVLALAVLPALSMLGATGALGVLAAIERRAMPVLLVSLIAFLVTGVYLMTTNGRYGGVGNVGSSWATMLLIKHAVVVAMLLVGSVVDGLVVRATRADVPTDPARALAQIGLGVDAMALLGLIVLLLTAAAQAG
jgi:uncharacterized membrane protein